jgi:hypothetical protein
VCRQVLPGQYAFVLHTASPFTGERGEMYGELVCGLGETLVGNHPGRPLAFSDRPDGSDMQVSNSKHTASRVVYSQRVNNPVSSAMLVWDGARAEGDKRLRSRSHIEL